MNIESQPSYSEITEKGTKVPLLNQELMSDIQHRTYKAAQPIINAHGGGMIAPETKYCHFVNKELKRILTGEGIQAEYQEHIDEKSRRGTILHAFVTPEYDGQKYLLDMQYQQFVPEEKRGELPDYMVFPYNSEQDVIDGLRKHHVKEDRIEHWTEALFPKPLSNSNLEARAFAPSQWPKNPYHEDNSRR